MERLHTLQEENRFLHSKIVQQQQQFECNLQLNNEQSFIMNNNDDNGEQEDDDEDSNDFFAKYQHDRSSAKLVNERKLQCSSRITNDDQIMLTHSHSTSSFFPDCHNSNVINTKNNFSRRSSSCIDIVHSVRHNADDDKLDEQTKNDCDKCQKINTYENRINDLEQRIFELEENNSVLKKLNRCIEIENENFAYKVCVLID